MISHQFIRENFEALEADFQREYGINLAEALWGEEPIGVRRLEALINGLSPDCALVRKLNTAGSQWGPTEELLAIIAEQIDATNQLLYSANFDAKKKPWKPLRIHRPYDRERVTVPAMSSHEDQQAFFAQSELGITVWDAAGGTE